MVCALSFVHPWILGLAVPVLIWCVAAWRQGARGRPCIPFPGIAWIPPEFGRGAAPRRALVLVRTAGLCGLLFLSAGPQGSSGSRPGQAPTAALVIVLDVSSSMTSADFVPLNRLEAARQSLRSFIGQLPRVDVGLVAVAGAPSLAAPVTAERSFVLRVLDRLRPAGFGEDGTALGTGLASAINRIRSGSWSSRRILLVTDGVSNRGALSPADAAALCRGLGIRVDTVGLGTDQVSRFTVPVAENQGREVEAKIEIDDAALARVAGETGGIYRRVRHHAELGQALAQVGRSFDSRTREAGSAWIPLVAPAVLLLLALEVLLIQIGFCELPQ